MINIVLEPSLNDSGVTKWILSHICTWLGLEYRFTSSLLDNNGILIYCGNNYTKPSACFNLIFPNPDLEIIRIKPPEIFYLEDVPIIAFTEPPKSFFDDNKINWDIISAISWLILRTEEAPFDTKPFWKPEHSVLKKDDIFKKPLIEIWLEAIALKLFGDIKRDSIWPDGKSAAIGLSHDIDILHHNHPRYILEFLKEKTSSGLIKAVRHSLRNMFEFGRKGYDIKSYVSIEKKYNLKSSIFVVPRTCNKRDPRDPLYSLDETIKGIPLKEYLKKFLSLGWDIGYHTPLISFDDKYIKDDVISFHKEITKDNLKGIRSHWLFFEPALLWDDAYDKNFLYDSSLGFNDAIGYRAGTGMPYLAWSSTSSEVLPLVEIPVVIMDVTLLAKHYMNKDVDEAKTIIKRYIDDTVRYKNLLTVNWHLETSDREKYPGWLEVYEWIIKEGLKRNLWVANLSEIASHFRNRYMKLSNQS